MSEAPGITEDSAPGWARGVRLRYDEARENWVIVSPERVSVLNQTAAEILRRIDGEKTVGTVVDELAAQFNAPRDLILKDVLRTLEDLRIKGLLTC